MSLHVLVFNDIGVNRKVLLYYFFVPMTISGYIVVFLHCFGMS